MYEVASFPPLTVGVMSSPTFKPSNDDSPRTPCKVDEEDEDDEPDRAGPAGIGKEDGSASPRRAKMDEAFNCRV